MTKRLLITLFCSTLATSAFAMSWGSITAYTSTKTNKTVPVQANTPFKYHTLASTCTLYLNDTSGTGLPLAATTTNTMQEITVPSNITNAIFSCTSTAGTTVYIIK